MPLYPNSDNNTILLASGNKGSIKYVDMIESKNLGYLHFLFRYAQKMRGYRASFTELAEIMNIKSEAPTETRPSLSLHCL